MTNSVDSGHTGAQDVSTFPTGRHVDSQTLDSARCNLRSRWRGADVQQSRRRGGTARTQVQPNHPHEPATPPISAALAALRLPPQATCQRVRGNVRPPGDLTPGWTRHIMDQLDLFAISDEPTTAREPVPWVEHHGTLTGYKDGCRCTACVDEKRDYGMLRSRGLRRCRHCQNTYPKGTGGYSFCQPCLDGGVYQRNQPKSVRVWVPCARCATEYPSDTRARYQFCPECTRHPVFDRMKGVFGKHHVPVDLVVAVLADPHCTNQRCRAPIMELVPVQKSQGWGTRPRYDYTIDHDHTCCPGDYSCGECIRGVLCRTCNRILSTDDPDILRGLADYLDSHASNT